MLEITSHYLQKKKNHMYIIMYKGTERVKTLF